MKDLKPGTFNGDASEYKTSVTNSLYAGVDTSSQMIRCPHCGKCHYREDYTTATALGWYHIIKDGVDISENPNTYTTHCTCLECGGEFTFDNKGEVTKGRTGEEIKKLQETSYTVDKSLNEHTYANTLKSNSDNYYVSSDSWKDYFNTITIQDGVENLKNVYKGITYKFNIQKVLDVLADVVEGVEVVNNKE